jgi:DNA-directed RNA polymerase subunit RPC12/RpoP
MRGRYGVDRLSQVMVLVAVLCAWAAAFLNDNIILMTLSLVLTVIFLSRVFSRNIVRRAKENRDFLNTFGSVKRAVLKFKRRIRDSRTYRYISCPQCKSKMRVPRGKGKIRVTCPKCSAKFESKS